MKTHTDFQTIYHSGRPAFVLVPYEEFESIRPLLIKNSIKDGIPQEVVEAHVLHNVPLIRAWREHLGLTQETVAERSSMKQPALARLERGDVKPRKATLLKLVAAMGLTLAQLEE